MPERKRNYTVGEPKGELAKRLYLFLRKVSEKRPNNPWVERDVLWTRAKDAGFQFDTYRVATEELEDNMAIGYLDTRYRYYELSYEFKLDNKRRLEWFDSLPDKVPEQVVVIKETKDEKEGRIKRERDERRLREYNMEIKRRKWASTPFKGSTRKGRMYEKQEGKCFYCTMPFDITDLTYDHVIPKSRGGGNGDSNLVLACAPCNHDKGNMMPDEYRVYRIKPVV